MAAPGRPWKPGQSGNPNGRPPKGRALTEILEKAGSKTIEYMGKRKSGKRVLAEMLWQLVVTGHVVYPDGNIVTPEFEEWFKAVEWLYRHVDGPPKAELDVTSGGASVTFREVVAVLPPEDGEDA